jgi:hypothetical protein
VSTISEVLALGTIPARLRFGPSGASTGWRVARNAARWTTIAVQVLACGFGVNKAVEDFLARPSLSGADTSMHQAAVLTGPWLMEAGLALALIFRQRRIGLVLCAAILLVLVCEPLSHWSSFSDLPGQTAHYYLYYLLYLATVCAVFPVFHRQAPRHGRPPLPVEA